MSRKRKIHEHKVAISSFAAAVVTLHPKVHPQDAVKWAAEVLTTPIEKQDEVGERLREFVRHSEEETD